MYGRGCSAGCEDNFDCHEVTASALSGHAGWCEPLYERRFAEPFRGPIITFGSLVEYYPISAKDRSRIHQFGKKVLPGLFLGYALYAGRIWKGDILVADIEELETMDASEICSKRLHAKEVIFPKEKG